VSRAIEDENRFIDASPALGVCTRDFVLNYVPEYGYEKISEDPFVLLVQKTKEAKRLMKGERGRRFEDLILVAINDNPLPSDYSQYLLIAPCLTMIYFIVERGKEEPAKTIARAFHNKDIKGSLIMKEIPNTVSSFKLSIATIKQ